MKASIPIGIPPGMRILHMERHKRRAFYHTIGELPRFEDGLWKLWLHTNDRILGTYLALHDNGKIERITVRELEGDEVVLIKSADGE